MTPRRPHSNSIETDGLDHDSADEFFSPDQPTPPEGTSVVDLQASHPLESSPIEPAEHQTARAQPVAEDHPGEDTAVLPVIEVQGDSTLKPGGDAPHGTAGGINVISPQPPDTSVFPTDGDRPRLESADDSAPTGQFDALSPDAIAAFESTLNQPPPSDALEYDDIDTSAPTGQIDALTPDAIAVFESTIGQPPSSDPPEPDDTHISAPTGQIDALTPDAIAVFESTIGQPPAADPPEPDDSDISALTGQIDAVPSDDEPTAITTVVDAVLVADDLAPLDPNDGAEPPPPDDQPDDQPDGVEDALASEPEATPKRRGLFGRRRDRRRTAAGAEPSAAADPPASGPDDPTPAADPVIARISSFDEQPAEEPDTSGSEPPTADDEPIFVSQDDALFDDSDPLDSELSASKVERRPRRQVILPPDVAGDLAPAEPSTAADPADEIDEIDTDAADSTYSDQALFTDPAVPPAADPAPSGGLALPGWVSDVRGQSDGRPEPARPPAAMFDNDIESGVRPSDPHLSESAGIFTNDEAPEPEDEPPLQPTSLLFGTSGPDIISDLLDDAAATEPGEASVSSAFDDSAYDETAALAAAQHEDDEDNEDDGFDPPTDSIDQTDTAVETDVPLIGSTDLSIDDELVAGWADDSWLDLAQDEQSVDPEDTDLEPADLVLFPDQFPPLPSDDEGLPTTVSDDFAPEIDGRVDPVGDLPAWASPDTLSLFDTEDRHRSTRFNDGARASPATDSEFFSLESALASLPPVVDPAIASMEDIRFEAVPDRSSNKPLREHQLAPDPVATPFELADVPEEPGLEVEVMLASVSTNQLVAAGAPGADPLTHHGASTDVFAELAELDDRRVADLFDAPGFETPDDDGDERIDRHDWWDFDDVTQRGDDRAGFRAAADATAAIDLTGTEQIRLGTSDLAAPPTATKSSDLDALDGPESEAYEAALYAFFDTPAHEADADADADAVIGLRSDEFTGKGGSKRRARRKAKALDPGAGTAGKGRLADDDGREIDGTVDDGLDDLDRWVEDTEDTHADWLERTKRSTFSNLLGVLVALAAIVGLLLATVWVVTNL